MSADIVDTKHWRSLLKHLEAIKSDQLALKREMAPLHVSDLLFRGHSNSDWTLKTTLDREVGDMSLHEYYRKVLALLPQVEVFTGREWSLPIPPRYRERLEHAESDLLLFGDEDDMELYRFLVYLRHHGFPSPLLDWTRSMYVAIYFAFAEKSEGESVAIYAYLGDTGPARAHQVGTPHIVQRGPYVRAHPRHFLQQAEYTVCTKKDANGEWTYTAHEHVFSVEDRAGDRLWKIRAPASMRSEVLQRLDEMNINAFSLFQTEDALMTAAKARAFYS